MAPLGRESKLASTMSTNKNKEKADAKETQHHGGQATSSIELQQLGAGASAGNAQKEGSQGEFKLSPLRWSTLLGVCVFGFCNSLSNESNAILNVYVEVLGLSLQKYVYLNQLFSVVPIAGALAAAALVDRLGAKLALFLALASAVVRNSARALMFSPHTPAWHHLRPLYWMLQRLFMLVTLVIYYCLPLRLAEGWFAESERSLALTLLVGAPILGSATASLLYPSIALDLASAQPLAYVNLACGLVSLLAVPLAVRRSAPIEGPPSERNQRSRQKEADGASLWANLRTALAHRQYMIQLTTLNIYEPLWLVVISLIQDIFLNAGLTRQFCGQFLAFSTVLGVIMQVGSSMAWQAGAQKAPARSPEERADPLMVSKCKALLACQCAAFLAFCHSLVMHELYPDCAWLIANQWWLLMATALLFILIRSWAAAHYNEQTAALICATISEPTAGACSACVICIYMNLISITMITLRRVAPSEPYEPGGQQEHATYSLSVLFVASAALCATLANLWLFRPNKCDGRAAGAKRARQSELPALA